MLKKKLLFVCLGNICRSPMAEGVMNHLISKQNQDKLFEIDSAGTAAYHVGNLPDTRMIATASKHGIILGSKARQFVTADFDKFNYIFAMDKSNYKNIIAMTTNSKQKEKVFLMRDYDEHTFRGQDVPDPYYGGDAGFENVYQILFRSCSNLLQTMLK